MLKDVKIHLAFWFILATLVRFAYPLPVCFHPDSVKYIVPLDIIRDQNFTWILETLNFSLVTRILNYFLQSMNNGDPSSIIVVQKIFGIISTILFFLIAKEITKNNLLWIWIGTLFFSFNPMMLFFEQIIMPESLFLLESLLLIFLLIKIFVKPSWIYLSIIALDLVLMLYTKETASVYLWCFWLFAFVFSLYSCFIQKTFSNIKIFVFAIVLYFGFQMPLIIYDSIKAYKIERSNPSTKGVILWFLTEEMLIENPSQDNQWLTYTILALYNQYKVQYKIPPQSKSRLAFEAAISRINVAIREGHLINPYTGLLVDRDYWNKMIPRYYLDTLIRNPQRTWESFVYNANLLLFKNNFYFSPYRNSNRPGTKYESVINTQVPFSLNLMVDPLLKNSQIIKASQMDENFIYTDSSHNQIIQGFVPFMLNRDSNQVFLYPEKGPSLFLQKTLRDFPFMRLVFPLFLSALIFFLVRLDKWIKQKDFLIVVFILCSALLFFLLPIMIHGESRYQLQFMHFMLLFILAVFYRCKAN